MSSTCGFGNMESTDDLDKGNFKSVVEGRSQIRVN